jgi:hypothetical protein
VARSSRQRKQARAKREAAAARKRRARRTRNFVQVLTREVNELYGRLADPATPVEEAAAVIAEVYNGSPVTSLMADSLLARGSSPARLYEIGEALLARSGAAPSVTALTFAARAASTAGDAAAARRLLDQALAVAAGSLAWPRKSRSSGAGPLARMTTRRAAAGP